MNGFVIHPVLILFVCADWYYHPPALCLRASISDMFTTIPRLASAGAAVGKHWGEGFGNGLSEQAFGSGGSNPTKAAELSTIEL